VSAMSADLVLCPHCKRPATEKTEHSRVRNAWLVRCANCDLWSVVPMAEKAPKPTSTHCRPDRDDWPHQWDAAAGWTVLDGIPQHRQSVCARCLTLRVETVTNDPDAHEHPCFCRDGRFCQKAYFVLIQE
jgi:hypothetical protein